jgi:hypothetical protein
VPSLYPGGQSLLGMPEQTGSVSLVPWTMMPAPLVGMAGRLLLWLNTIELCLMSPVEDCPEVHDLSAVAGRASAVQ